MKNWKVIPFFVCLMLFLSATASAADAVSVTLLFPDGTWLRETVDCPENASLWYASYDGSGKMAEAGRAPVEDGRAVISLSEDADVVEAFAFGDGLRPLAPAAPLTAPSFYERGIDRFFNGDYAGAIADFTAAIQADEETLSAYIWRGDAYIGLGETAENLAAAQADYEAALALDETIPDAYLGLADVSIRRADYERATDILLKGMNKAADIDAIQWKLNQLEFGDVWDSSGNLRRESGYGDNGALVWRHDYSYDEQGRQSAVTAYDAEGNQTGHIDLSYDADGNPLVGFDYDYEDGKLRRTVSEYDEHGNLVKYSDYDPEGLLSYSTLYQYDERGYVIRQDVYYRDDETGEMQSHYELSQYDETGMIVRQDEYSSENVLQGYHTWSYAADGQVKEYRYYSMESGSPELEAREVSEYNGRGDLIMETRYDGNGNVELIRMYRYDQDGNRIGITYYDGDGNILYQS